MLNMEKLYRWVILFLKLCLITVCKIMLRHFTNKGMESRESKLIIKQCIWLNFIFWVLTLYFQILTVYLSSLGQVFLPIAVMLLLYIRIKLN